MPETLRQSLQAFPKLLARDQTVNESEIADACARVAEWADDNWKAATAFQFAELAAKAQPSNPQRALYAGRVCRGMGFFDRANVWFERGFRLAVQQGNRSEIVRALLGQGALMQECGELDEAQRWFIKAARTGRKKRAAEVRHDLMALAAERGDFITTVQHARAAVDLYPLRHHRLPFLAHISLSLCFGRDFPRWLWPSWRPSSALSLVGNSSPDSLLSRGRPLPGGHFPGMPTQSGAPCTKSRLMSSTLRRPS